MLTSGDRLTTGERFAVRLRVLMGTRTIHALVREAKAKRIPLSRTTVRWVLFDAKRGPSLDTLEALARVLGVSIGELVEGDHG